jgi:cytochrome c oxidase assembly protein subunit 15
MAQRLLTPAAKILLALQALLVLTGGTVRVTGSGMGCPTWPECTTDSYTPVPGQAEGAFHAWIEFGNRLLTFALGGAALLVIILVLVARRKDLYLLALSQIGGIFAQVILGGITVLTHLNPFSVASHFLLSTLLIAAAYTLVIRNSRPKLDRARQSPLLLLHTFLAFAVIVAGTMLTGAGPHAGDVKAQRIEVPIPTLAAIHGFLVIALILLTLVIVYRAVAQADEVLQRGILFFLAICLAQGVIGYIQYLQGVPELLVAAHLLGSTILWVSACRVRATQYYNFSRTKTNERDREQVAL